MPVPVTVPAPDCLAKVMTVVLSAVTVLPAASWIVAVSTRGSHPDARLAVEPLRSIVAAEPWTMSKLTLSATRPAALPRIVIVPASCPVTVFDATPAVAVSVPRPVTVPAPDALAKVTTVVLSPVIGSRRHRARWP